MRSFFIDSSTARDPVPIIKGSDANHIKNVLRLKPGDKVRLLDGNGENLEALIKEYKSDAVIFSIIRRLPPTSESPVQITIAQGLLKDKKMDGIIKPLTEMGVTKVQPFMAKRSIPQPDKKRLSKRIDRWEKIAKEAVKQCGRSCVPEIGELASFKDVIIGRQQHQLSIIFWEDEIQSINLSNAASKAKIEKVLAIIGPEGGFTDEEIMMARENGFIVASLGPRILRAETAPIVACTLIQYIFGDMGTKIS